MYHKHWDTFHTMINVFNRREFGLERFVPVSLMESMKRKELRKLLSHLLKLNQTMTGTSHKCLTSLQAKLYYLSIISELPSYGAKCFSTNIRVSLSVQLWLETNLLIDHFNSQQMHLILLQMHLILLLTALVVKNIRLSTKCNY